MKSFFLMILLGAGLVSCGPGEENQSVRKQYKVIYPEEPVAYFLPRTDPDCGHGKQVLDDLSKVFVWIAVKNGSKLTIEQKEFDLSGFFADGLKNPTLGITGIYPDSTYIESTFRNNHMIRYEPLKICRKSYPRESLENAALAVAVGLKQGGIFYQSLDQARALKNLDVLLQPKIFKEKKISEDTVEHTMLNNVAFTTVSDGNQNSVMVVGPESSAFRFKGRLWEQPAVIIHEYAHHIYSHYQFFRQGRMLPKSFQAPQLPAINYVDGLNEGFADLFSRLALEHFSSESGVNVEDRLFISDDDIKKIRLRNIEESSFESLNHRLEKKFNLKNHKFSGYVDHLIADYHVAGAVFANIAFRTMTDDISIGGENALKYGSSLLRWIGQKIEWEGGQSLKQAQMSYMTNAMNLFAKISLETALASEGRWKAQVLCGSFVSDFELFFPGSAIPACTERFGQ